MQLTRAADYGVRVMVELAGMPEGDRTSLQFLTQGTGAPESFLSKVLQALTRVGFINSWRGQGGGFEISTSGRGASMRAVIEAIDGPIALNVCLADGKECRRSAVCPAHPVWAKAQQAMLAVLDDARICDLAQVGLSAGAAESATLPIFVQTGSIMPARDAVESEAQPVL